MPRPPQNRCVVVFGIANKPQLLSAHFGTNTPYRATRTDVIST